MTNDIKKAIEYAIERHGTHIAFEPDRFESRVAYLEGYHSRDEEVKELREALKELIYASINTCDMQSYIKGEEIPEDAWDKNIDYLRDKAEQAKQLLKEEE